MSAAAHAIRSCGARRELDSELTRRLSEQRVTLLARLAGQSSTLLDGHPRIKELKAPLADLDHRIREEASKISRSRQPGSLQKVSSGNYL